MRMTKNIFQFHSISLKKKKFQNPTKQYAFESKKYAFFLFQFLVHLKYHTFFCDSKDSL